MNQNDYIQNLLQQEKYQEVLSLLQQQLGIKDDASTRAIMAQCHHRLGNFSASVDELTNALKMKPREAQLYSDRGVSYFMLGNREAALNDFDKAQELEPQNPYRYSSRAYVKDAFGDVQGAVSDYQHSLALDPEDAIASNNLGMVLEKLGFRQEAQQHFNKADALNNASIPKPALVNPATPDKPMPSTAGVQEKKSISLRFYASTLKSVFTTKQGFRDFMQFWLGKKSGR